MSVKQRRGLLSSHVITFLTASRGEEGAHLRTWVSFWLKAFFYECVCVWFPAVSASNGEQFTSGRFLSSDTFWCPWSHWNKCVLDGSGCVCAFVRERVCSKWLMKTWSCSWNLITLLFLSLLTRFAGIKTHSRLNPPRNNKWNTHTLSHTHCCRSLYSRKGLLSFPRGSSRTALQCTLLLGCFSFKWSSHRSVLSPSSQLMVINGSLRLLANQPKSTLLKWGKSSKWCCCVKTFSVRSASLHPPEFSLNKKHLFTSQRC